MKRKAYITTLLEKGLIQKILGYGPLFRKRFDRNCFAEEKALRMGAPRGWKGKGVGVLAIKIPQSI